MTLPLLVRQPLQSLSRVWVSVILMSLVTLSPADAQDLEPGVVIDAERGAAYAMAPGGGVQALDLAQGRVLWSTFAGARPLALQGRRLLTQAESKGDGLRLASLDVAARGRVLRTIEAAMPEGAAAPIDLPAGVEFRTAARRDGNAIELWWTYVRYPLRGMDPDAEDEQEEQEARVERRGGTLRVDLATGATESLAGRPQDEGPRALPAAVATKAEAGAYRQRPLWAGEQIVAIGPIDVDGRRTLVLRRFTAEGAALPEVALPDGVTLQLPSIDNRYVLVSGASGDARPEHAHAWTIFAVANGARVAQFTAPVAAAPFVVAGGRVLFVTRPWGHRDGADWIEEPLQLHAVDVTAGQVVWARALRDTTYNGPWAP